MANVEFLLSSGNHPCRNINREQLKTQTLLIIRQTLSAVWSWPNVKHFFSSQWGEAAWGERLKTVENNKISSDS